MFVLLYFLCTKPSRAKRICNANMWKIKKYSILLIFTVLPFAVSSFFFYIFVVSCIFFLASLLANSFYRSYVAQIRYDDAHRMHTATGTNNITNTICAFRFGSAALYVNENNNTNFPYLEYNSSTKMYVRWILDYTQNT